MKRREDSPSTSFTVPTHLRSGAPMGRFARQLCDRQTCRRCLAPFSPQIPKDTFPRHVGIVGSYHRRNCIRWLWVARPAPWHGLKTVTKPQASEPAQRGVPGREVPGRGADQVSGSQIGLSRRATATRHGHSFRHVEVNVEAATPERSSTSGGAFRAPLDIDGLAGPSGGCPPRIRGSPPLNSMRI